MVSGSPETDEMPPVPTLAPPPGPESGDYEADPVRDGVQEAEPAEDEPDIVVSVEDPDTGEVTAVPI